uniref:Uncharacterized protein n=1 Tax=Pristionchus pacificus TaxID=54126 RepID=A0A2A6BRT0_PRIPA|eukprot:PDM68461.1 hypothetical protein PRIPAC_43963 [Pristionchus pacificus]
MYYYCKFGEYGSLLLQSVRDRSIESEKGAGKYDGELGANSSKISSSNRGFESAFPKTSAH